MRQIIRQERGQGMTEAAILLPILILLLLGLFDFYYINGRLFEGYIQARNRAWQNEDRSDMLNTVFGNVGQQQDTSSLFNMLMQTNHGHYQETIDSNLYVLPPRSLSINCYCDRNPWKFRFGLDEIINFFKKSPAVDDHLKDAEFKLDGK